MREINIVIATNTEGIETVAAFPDREQAIGLFKQLRNKDVAVSIHSVEIGSYKEFIQEFNLGE